MQPVMIKRKILHCDNDQSKKMQIGSQCKHLLRLLDESC